MRVEIIRHGETAWMAERRYQGRTDVPLSEEGIRRLHPADFFPETVYVSGMTRSVQTASAVFPDAAQVTIPGLAEMDFGVFEGRTADEMENDADYRRWVDGFCTGKCPGGESGKEFCDRICLAFAALMDDLTAEEAPKDCIIVAHGGTAMAIMERYTRTGKSFYEWHLKSGCGYVLEGKNWKSNRTLELISCSDYNR